MSQTPVSGNAKKDALCITRALKVSNYLRRTLPNSIPQSSLQPLLKLPAKTLSTLHDGSNLHRVITDPKLRKWLAENPVPVPKATVTDTLFHGTLVFVLITYNRPNQQPFSLNSQDAQTAVNYASLAVGPIQRYVSQYGPNSLQVSSNILNFTVNLQGNTFTDDNVQGWVDTIVNDNHLTNACVVILHDAVTANSPTNSKCDQLCGGYHLMTQNGHPYCFCKVFGQNLTIADVNDDYAEVLSHEIAEMAVDPKGDVNNPEVCDGCAPNCKNDQFDLFDSKGTFVGGTNNPSTAHGFTFFINSIIRPDAYDPKTECAVAGSDLKAVCIYAPPVAWNGQGDLTTVPNIVSIAGHFSTGDQRHLVVVGTGQGKVHEIFWKPAQQGIEGQDDLPITFGAGSIVSVATMYNSDQQRHVVLVGKNDGKVHEIFWKPETVGIEGHDDLPVAFAPGSIVAVSALYNRDQQRYVALVGTRAGKVHEIFWKDSTVGVEGDDDLPVTFAPGSIVAVTGFYNTDQQRYVVVVGTSAGKLHEIFWKDSTVGVEGHDDLPVSFGSGSIVAVSGFYDASKQRHIVVVATTDGRIHQVYWKATTVGIEENSTVAQLNAGSVVGLAGFYSASDQVEHIVVGLTNGLIREFWTTADV